MVYYFFFSFPQPKRKFKEIRITSRGGLFGSGELFVKFGFRGGGLFKSGSIIDHLWYAVTRLILWCKFLKCIIVYSKMKDVACSGCLKKKLNMKSFCIFCLVFTIEFLFDFRT